VLIFYAEGSEGILRKSSGNGAHMHSKQSRSKQLIFCGPEVHPKIG
jgi:hypothetical protein